MNKRYLLVIVGCIECGIGSTILAAEETIEGLWERVIMDLLPSVIGCEFKGHDLWLGGGQSYVCLADTEKLPCAMALLPSVDKGYDRFRTVVEGLMVEDPFRKEEE